MMGMFDYVDAPEVPCPECGEMIGGWQSKSGPCELLRLQPKQVANFYTSCNECHVWIEYTRDEPTPDDPFAGFTRTVERL